jgi:PAS domain S-box-containing protein
LTGKTDYSKDKILFLLELYRKASSLPENDLYKYFLNHAVKITQSEIGFFHFVGDDQKTITLTAWNKEALNHCTAKSNTHYAISQAGNWANSIRLKQPIIYNNFKQSPDQKGLPEGHVPITRILSFPLIENGKVHAVFGVGNKKQLYEEYDVVQLELISTELNKILKQRDAESELLKSKEMYSSLFSNMIDAFAYCKMIFDESGKPEDFEYLQINDAFEKITGLRREDIVGRRVSEAIPGIKNDNPELFEIYGRVASGGISERFELFFKPLELWLDVSVYSPAKGYFVAVFDDMTNRKKAEEALQKLNEELEARIKERTIELATERERLLTLLEYIPAMVCLLTPDHYVIFANRSFKEKFGEAEGRPCHEFCFYNKEPDSFCETYKVLETGKPYRWQIKTTDGSIIDTYDFPFADIDGSTLILEMGIDITEQKRMEQQLKDSERLAAIGATAGMVGHDIRNPLQAISSDVFLIKSDLSSMPEGEAKEGITESAAGIEQNIKYMNKIVQDLQDYARPLAPASREVDLEKLCEDTLFKNGVPENIDASCQIENKVKNIVTDPEMLRRILNNLVTNATQAMSDGGKLEVHAYQESGNTMITVKDTGGGITEDIKAKLFTPLFTTKSKGQGFGLAVVRRMTEALGGTITYESKVGEGTKFILSLPSK